MTKNTKKDYIIGTIIGIILGLSLPKPTKAHGYKYNAIVTSVYDGDTIKIKISNGFRSFTENESIRFLGINAPEVRFDKNKPSEKAEGIVSRDYLRSLILGKKVILETIPNKKGIEKKGKYGRYLGVIWYKGLNVNKILVDKGYAKYKGY